MPSFIVIESRKDTAFTSEARAVLDSHNFIEVNPGTFSSSTGAQSAKQALKNLSK